MADNKSVLEQALLEAQQLEEAVKSNAKGILAATMKQEIEELVKESLTEQEEDDFVNVKDTEEGEEFDFDDGDFDDEEYEDLENEVSVNLPDEEEAMVSMSMDADEPLDLTLASDEEVLKVFKAMGTEDGIVVTQDGDTIDIEDQEAGTEYKIELAENKLNSFRGLINEGSYKSDKHESVIDDESDDEIKEGMKKDMYELKMKDEPMYEVELEEDDVTAEDLEEMMQSKKDRRDERGGMRKYYGENPDGLHSTGRKNVQGYNAREDESLGMSHAHEAHGKDLEELRHKESHEAYEREMREGHYGMNKGNKYHRHDVDGHEKEAGEYGAYMGEGHDEEHHEAYGVDKEANEGHYGKEHHEAYGVDKEANEGHYGKQGDMEEASRTYGFGSKSGRGLRKAITPNRNYVYPMNESTKKHINNIIRTAKQLQEENQAYREKNKEYRQALKLFREKLNEVAVFNANLAYSTKLFTENTTTKKEKINILRRFDNVKTLNESKNLFTNINQELGSKVNKLNESVQKTITKTPSGGSSINLIETKTYENPQIARMKDIMNKL